MSVYYSDGLSPYDEKGICGLPEIVDDPEDIEEKIHLLKGWILNSKCVLIHCGAGISTSCGIPDFRGPKGVWTEEMRGQKNNGDHKEVKEEANGKGISFEDSKPSFTHRALAKLVSCNYIHYIISQNVDGLFLKTGIKRKYISELHGNFFLDECNHCETRFISTTASRTMGLKVSNRRCQRPRRPCRGFLRDTILDWEDNLPEGELQMARDFAKKADLSICLGTSLQIVPAANLPFVCRKRKNNPGKVAIINLQATKHDSKADLVIHDYVDSVMRMLCKLLDVSVPDYDTKSDLTIFDPNSVRVWE